MIRISGQLAWQCMTHVEKDLGSLMNQHSRESLRLRGWDYTSSAMYFVTICTQRGKALFGEIVDERLQMNVCGRIVDECWQWLADQYAFVSLDNYVIMPNHLHGVIWLQAGRRGGSRTAPTLRIKPLGRLIGAFKTVSTKRINVIRGTPGKVVWQRGFYDHIIRDQRDLDRIRQYIRLNPLHWALDQYYVDL